MADDKILESYNGFDIKKCSQHTTGGHCIKIFKDDIPSSMYVKNVSVAKKVIDTYLKSKTR